MGLKVYELNKILKAHIKTHTLFYPYIAAIYKKSSAFLNILISMIIQNKISEYIFLL